jgi:hypothetical protein
MAESSHWANGMALGSLATSAPRSRHTFKGRSISTHSLDCRGCALATRFVRLWSAVHAAAPPFWELIGTAKTDPLHTPERCDVT